MSEYMINEFKRKKPTYNEIRSIPDDKNKLSMYTHNLAASENLKEGNQEWGKGQLEKTEETDKKTI